MEASKSFPSNSGSYLESFNFSSWNHSTDGEFLSNLTFNDETNMFYSSYGTVEDGVATRVGFSVPALKRDDKNAWIEGPQSRWLKKASGRVENVYPEFELLTLGRSLVNLFSKGTADIGARIGTKLEYVFGKAGGNKHNIERSQGMLKQLESVGIFDTPASRSYIKSHLSNIYRATPGVLQKNGRYARESLLMGPNGALKVQIIWENRKLITLELFGGK